VNQIWSIETALTVFQKYYSTWVKEQLYISMMGIKETGFSLNAMAVFIQ
jgi:hypothetical protein